MSFTDVFNREDGTSYIAVWIGADSEAVAVGNGFSETDESHPNFRRDSQSRNAITHARESAQLTDEWGRETAENLGDYKESTSEPGINVVNPHY